MRACLIWPEIDGLHWIFSSFLTDRLVAVAQQHCLLSGLHKNAIIGSSRQLLFHNSVAGFSATEARVRRTCLRVLGIVAGNH